MRHDKGYTDSLRRTRKAHKAYDNAQSKYVESGFPKGMERTMNSLANHVNKAESAYNREYARIVKESRDQSTETVYAKYHYKGR